VVSRTACLSKHQWTANVFLDTHRTVSYLDVSETETSLRNAEIGTSSIGWAKVSRVYFTLLEGGDRIRSPKRRVLNKKATEQCLK
jgi:hypothetical protein